MMDHLRFEELIDAYGADPARWPAAERAEAERFAADRGWAADRNLAAEHALDAALDAFATEAPSAALRQRILAAAPRPRQPRTWRRTGTFWLSGASLAAACAVGVVAGVGLSGTLIGGGAQVDRDAEASAAFGTVTLFGAPIDVGGKG